MTYLNYKHIFARVQPYLFSVIQIRKLYLYKFTGIIYYTVLIRLLSEGRNVIDQF